MQSHPVVYKAKTQLQMAYSPRKRALTQSSLYGYQAQNKLGDPVTLLSGFFSYLGRLLECIEGCYAQRRKVASKAPGMGKGLWFE